MNPLNLNGQRFGRLIVLERVPYKARRTAWKCLCDCGKITKVPTGDLRSGHTRSCGCTHKEIAKNLTLNHGHAGRGRKTTVYVRWQSMISRCRNPLHERYADYGGRGISVCERWMWFENFLQDMGQPPHRSVLDRLNNDGNYEPGNCAWSTYKQSNRNRRDNILITVNGEALTLTEWSERTGVPYHVLQYRHNHGWPIEKLFILKLR